MIQTPAKGQSAPLHVTPKEKMRVQVGISWDTDRKRIQKGIIFKKDEMVNVIYDLDLFCCIYDQSGEIIDYVTPENANLMDSSEQIYHSGDNQTGRIGGDDEFISVNIAHVPENIHSIVFFAMCADKNKFKDVAGVEARVADGMSDENQILVTPNTLQGSDKDGFIFAALIRDTAQPHGWSIKNICEFRSNDEIEDWGAVGAAYIR